MSDVTLILQAIQDGEEDATDQLMSVVYEELHRLAAAKMSRERPGQTLQPTALVHEAWLKLAGSNVRWKNRRHFFAAAAESMRRILIDRARHRAVRENAAPDDLKAAANSSAMLESPPPDEMLAVHEAIDELAREKPEAAELVKLRYFVGLTMPEAAEAMDLPLRTAERYWAFARAWLREAIRA